MQVQAKEAVARRAEAAEKLAAVIQRGDASRIVSSLADGLTTLRKLMYQRIHHDVEETYGQDSMLMPLSEEKCEHRIKTEIEVYQVAVCAEEVDSCGYVAQDLAWFADWLAHLRLGEHYADSRYDDRLSTYLDLDREKRRSAFVKVLQRTLPETSKAPLIVYRLFPLGVRIVTAIAFGDVATARQQRVRQNNWLPAIADCHHCHGHLLDNGEVCRECGNPVWKYQWLTAVD
ncbi:MAG: hypothetical protein RIC55_11320 [Pirellulaceae bacterium]